MSGFLFSKKQIAPLRLVIDIESGSIGAGLFDVTNHGKPMLCYTARQNFVFQKILSGQALFSTMRKTLELALTRVEHEGLRSLNSATGKIHVVNSVDALISSPWFASETKNLKVEYDKPRVITKAVVDKLFENEQRQFEARSAALEKKKADSYALLERKIMRVCLNGYPTSKPYGKLAGELALSVAINIASYDFLEKVKLTITRRFPVHSFAFHTFSLAAFATIRDYYPDNADFIFARIGGEVTDIIISKRGIITETVSFPLGQNGLLRNVEKFFVGSPHAALESLLKLLHDGKMAAMEKSRMQNALAKTEVEWLALFNNVISNLLEETFLPKSLFLLHSGPYVKVFEGFLRKAKSSQFTVTAEPFVIIPVDDSSAHLNIGYQREICHDIALGLEADFLARFSGPAK